MTASEKAPELWVSLGYYSLYTKKNVRALYYAQKVVYCKIRPSKFVGIFDVNVLLHT